MWRDDDDRGTCPLVLVNISMLDVANVHQRKSETKIERKDGRTGRMTSTRFKLEESLRATSPAPTIN